PIENREKALEFVLNNLPPEQATKAIAELLPDSLPEDGAGPWLNLALRTGDAGVIARVFSQTTSKGFNRSTTLSALQGIQEAVTQRQISLQVDAHSLVPLIQDSDLAVRIAAIALGGT